MSRSGRRQGYFIACVHSTPPLRSRRGAAVQCYSPGGSTPGNSWSGGGVPPGSPNPDTISDQKMHFSTPVFRPDL